MPDLKIITMRDVETESVEWLWHPYIPAGKITIVQGDPGDGKTTMMLAVAAAVTTGEALRWTKGKHQFIVAAHTNTENPHCHIVYNSTNLNCDGKYQDFKRSAIALRKLSDRVCLEHGLSVIEKPGLSKGYNRSEYLGENKTPTVREQLRDLMDTALSACKDFDGFFAALIAAGVEVEQRGTQVRFKLSGGKKFIRQDSLGDDYSTDAIIERIKGKRIVAPRQKSAAPVRDERKPNLLIDIQSKMQEGKGEGYRQWATGFNLQQMAKTLSYLSDNGLKCYEDLVKETNAVTGEYNRRLTRIKEIDARQNEITELQKHIGTYRKTREIYQQYRASGKDVDFYEQFRKDLALHEAAKKYFDEHGYGKDKKLPPMQSLKQEWATLAAEKKTLYSGWRELSEKRKELLVAKGNADRILGIDKSTQTQNTDHKQKRSIFSR